MKRSLIFTICSAVANFLLSLIKIFIGIVSNSVTIFFDAINNMMDVLGSSLGAVGIKVASRTPTNEYPSGYGKVEYIVSLIIALGTLIFGGLFVFYSVERIMYPLPVYFAWLYFWLLVLTLVVKVAMGVTFYSLYRRDHSHITKALYTDCFLDACITGCAVICYGLSQRIDTVIDAILGVVLGIVIMVATVKVIVSAIHGILDYNDRIDIDALTRELCSSHVYDSVDKVIVQGRAAYVIGEIGTMVDNVQDAEQHFHVKIYDIREMNTQHGEKEDEDR